MKRKIFSKLNLFKNPLVKGSLILFIGGTTASFFGYLFHLVIGRMIGPENYGSFSSLFSTLYFVSIFTTVFILVIVKFISEYLGKGDSGIIKLAFSFLFKKGIFFSLIAGVVFLFISPFLSVFLKIYSLVPFILISIIVFTTFPFAVARAFLQGTLNFLALSASMIGEMFLRLTLSVLFVFCGLKTNGAVLGLSLSALLAFILTTWPLRHYLRLGEGISAHFPDFGKMVKFSLPVLALSLSFVSLYSFDIILVKHFFSPTEAGYYSAISTLGKIIFWFSSPIISVSFPLLSKRKSEKKNFFKIMISSILLIAGLSTVVVFIYKLFPELMVKLLFGDKYLPAAYLVFPFAIFIFLHTLSNGILSAYLSLSLVKPVILAVIAAIFQGVLIILFHNDLTQVILISQAVCGILFVSLLLFLPKVYTLQEKQND